MKLAILGGSFNPIHVGHLYLADLVLSNLGYDRVVLVPAHVSPFKEEVPGMPESACDRLLMIAAAIQGDSRLTVDDCELERGGLSYTVDTLRDIIDRYRPSGKPALIIGDDLAADFPRWKDGDRIPELADPVIARRLGSAPADLPFPHTLLKNEPLEVSSRMLRERIAAGGAWRYLVPEGARRIIEERGLYGCPERQPVPEIAELWKGGKPPADVIGKVEAAARENLGMHRFLHSRNVAWLAADLCRRFSQDPETGYLAGIAHDLAKQLTEREQLKLAEKAGLVLSSLETEKPSLLHGRTAALILRDHFGIRHEGVLHAVASHTTGAGQMGVLDKIVYIADKVEVSRPGIPPELRDLAFRGNDLDGIFLEVFRETVGSLRSGKRKLSQQTLALWEHLRELASEPGITKTEDTVPEDTVSEDTGDRR